MGRYSKFAGSHDSVKGENEDTRQEYEPEDDGVYIIPKSDATYYREQSNVQDDINNADTPLIGLEFTLELQQNKVNSTKSVITSCILCDKSSDLIAHCRTEFHRLNYIRELFPPIYEALIEQEMNIQRSKVIKEIATIIEREFGRQRPVVVLDSMKKEAIAFLKKLIPEKKLEYEVILEGPSSNHEFSKLNEILSEIKIFESNIKKANTTEPKSIKDRLTNLPAMKRSSSPDLRGSKAIRNNLQTDQGTPSRIVMITSLLPRQFNSIRLPDAICAASPFGRIKKVSKETMGDQNLYIQFFEIESAIQMVEHSTKGLLIYSVVFSHGTMLQVDNLEEKYPDYFKIYSSEFELWEKKLRKESNNVIKDSLFYINWDLFWHNHPLNVSVGAANVAPIKPNFDPDKNFSPIDSLKYLTNLSCLGYLTSSIGTFYNEALKLQRKNENIFSLFAKSDNIAVLNVALLKLNKYKALGQCNLEVISGLSACNNLIKFSMISNSTVNIKLDSPADCLAALGGCYDLLGYLGMSIAKQLEQVHALEMQGQSVLDFFKEQENLTIITLSIMKLEKIKANCEGGTRVENGIKACNQLLKFVSDSGCTGSADDTKLQTVTYSPLSSLRILMDCSLHLGFLAQSIKSLREQLAAFEGQGGDYVEFFGNVDKRAVIEISLSKLLKLELSGVVGLKVKKGIEACNEIINHVDKPKSMSKTIQGGSDLLTCTQGTGSSIEMNSTPYTPLASLETLKLCSFHLGYLASSVESLCGQVLELVKNDGDLVGLFKDLENKTIINFSLNKLKKLESTGDVGTAVRNGIKACNDILNFSQESKSSEDTNFTSTLKSLAVLQDCSTQLGDLSSSVDSLHEQVLTIDKQKNDFSYLLENNVLLVYSCLNTLKKFSSVGVVTSKVKAGKEACEELIKKYSSEGKTYENCKIVDMELDEKKSGSYTPLNSLTVLTQCLDHLGYLTSSVKKLHERVAYLERGMMDLSPLFRDQENLTIINICMRKFMQIEASGRGDGKSEAGIAACEDLLKYSKECELSLTMISGDVDTEKKQYSPAWSLSILVGLTAHFGNLAPSIARLFEKASEIERRCVDSSSFYEDRHAVPIIISASKKLRNLEKSGQGNMEISLGQGACDELLKNSKLLPPTCPIRELKILNRCSHFHKSSVDRLLQKAIDLKRNGSDVLSIVKTQEFGMIIYSTHMKLRTVRDFGNNEVNIKDGIEACEALIKLIEPHFGKGTISSNSDSPHFLLNSISALAKCSNRLGIMDASLMKLLEMTRECQINDYDKIIKNEENISIIEICLKKLVKLSNNEIGYNENNAIKACTDLLNYSKGLNSTNDYQANYPMPKSCNEGIRIGEIGNNYEMAESVKPAGPNRNCDNSNPSRGKWRGRPNPERIEMNLEGYNFPSNRAIVPEPKRPFEFEYQRYNRLDKQPYDKNSKQNASMEPIKYEYNHNRSVLPPNAGPSRARNQTSINQSNMEMNTPKNIMGIQIWDRQPYQQKNQDSNHFCDRSDRSIKNSKWQPKQTLHIHEMHAPQNKFTNPINAQRQYQQNNQGQNDFGGGSYEKSIFDQKQTGSNLYEREIHTPKSKFTDPINNGRPYQQKIENKNNFDYRGSYENSNQQRQIDNIVQNKEERYVPQNKINDRRPYQKQNEFPSNFDKGSFANSNTGAEQTLNRSQNKQEANPFSNYEKKRKRKKERNMQADHRIKDNINNVRRGSFGANQFPKPFDVDQQSRNEISRKDCFQNLGRDIDDNEVQVVSDLSGGLDLANFKSLDDEGKDILAQYLAGLENRLSSLAKSS